MQAMQKKAIGYTLKDKLKEWWCLLCYETYGKYPDKMRKER